MYLVPLSSLPALSSIQDSQQSSSITADSAAGSFASIMQEAIETLEKSQQASQMDSYDLAMGDISSLSTIMINAAMETTAVETVVQLTSRAVSAYKEVMQMQI